MNHADRLDQLFSLYSDAAMNVEQPSPDEAMAHIRHEHKLPIGAQLSSGEIDKALEIRADIFREFSWQPNFRMFSQLGEDMHHPKDRTQHHSNSSPR